MNTIDEIIQDIEEHAGDCKIEIHKAVPMTQAQQVAVAVAFERFLDNIEDRLREELLSEDERGGADRK